MGTVSKFFVLLVIVSAVVYALPREETTVGVNLHGVNHTAQEFSFYVNDPFDPSTVSGGSGVIEAFSASGISCCAVLPRVWKSGLKLQIHTTHWLKKLPDGRIPEIKEVVEVNVPRYVDGKPGELWVLRHDNGNLEVVSSDYQPDHPRWPGTQKGWPVPSLEYRRERWELYKQIEESDVETFARVLEELEEAPERRAKKDWESTKKSHPDDLKDFSGPDDPLYVAKLKASYVDALAKSKRDLLQIMEAKP